MIFFFIVLAVHTVVNLYIAIRGWQALEAASNFRPWFIAFMILVYVAYPAGRILEKIWYHPIPITLHWVGAFWFAAMLYVTLMLFLTDIGRIANHFFPFLEKIAGSNVPAIKLKFFIAVSAISGLIILFGHINAWYPKTSRIDIVIPKEAGNLQSLRIVAVSDVHLGTIIGPRKTGKMVESINRMNPDIILFAGDIVDEDVKPVIKQNLGRNLQQLKAPLGIYASTGNHEYIGGGDPSINYLEQNGIRVLRDTVISIHDNFYVVGREDLHKKWVTGNPRKDLSEILKDIDRSKPVILLDHQPYNLDDAMEAGVDLQISGHTHHGQLWPFGYVTNRIFEVSRGYKQKGNTHYYVSTGFGTWGPPVRTGNRPEIVLINLYFE
ncbi:metallophosphoesterase [Alkalitalea saponilacus]|uniref:Calcineurin-like phosphoesterase domain-containing protein n=1 Tax=Alkalitalea saponilacus TaxID=889453 RepID=A0A1T5CN03_9BACT|nr:metallophosphoesterase [Alkalitalea saponilacus]SKB60794.1 hypothetical protein SAMN03080601_00884 [Alkalitalea saponilacus]